MDEITDTLKILVIVIGSGLGLWAALACVTQALKDHHAYDYLKELPRETK